MWPLICLLLPVLTSGQAFKWDILPRLSKYPYFLSLGIPDPVLDQANLPPGDDSITSGRERETQLLSQFAKKTPQASSEIFNLSSNKSCVALKARRQMEGTCTGVFDVVVARRCAGLKLIKSPDCPESEVCCYDPQSSPERKSFSVLDRSACGVRRTPELVTRDLKMTYSGELQVTHRLQQRLLEELTAPNEICWQAAITIDGNYACSGAIINSQHILTAAHCLQEVNDVRRLRVLIGTSDLSRLGSCSASLSVSKILFDNFYDPQTFAHDLAIVKLAKLIDDATCACRVCLPSTDTDALLDDGNLRCIATGYRKAAAGRTTISTERIALSRNNHCGSRLNLAPALTDFLAQVDNSLLCGVSVGSENTTDRAEKACSNQDTGSPLACQLDRSPAHTLIGLSSWRLPCEENAVQIDMSKSSQAPTIYAKVASALQWISEKSRL
ncbi:hypothetical protein RvY_04041 [Ramazzottius varieornatus]|uniref:Peptidase S1 domain-containing protein n=1 Tax=Ramazzottius varieornatus TaxID=947166 RepID=A0A1D1UZH4_RAMVA|nr:hypothetical protein RvY_04041 [Ramazzottius varieornatus]